MPLFDDLANFLRRNFTGSDPSAAATTLINQANIPALPDGRSPASQMAAQQVGARALIPGETVSTVRDVPTAGIRPPNGGLTPERATEDGLRMMAAGQPPVAPPPAPAAVAPQHRPEQLGSIVNAVFPGGMQPGGAFNEHQKRLMQFLGLPGMVRP